MAAVLPGDDLAVLEEFQDRVLDDPFAGLAHFEALEEDQRLVDAVFDFSQAVPQASGFQKYLADSDKVVVGFPGLVETRQEPFSGLAAQGCTRGRPAGSSWIPLGRLKWIYRYFSANRRCR